MLNMPNFPLGHPKPCIPSLPLARLVAALAVASPMLATGQVAVPLIFNTTAPTNDLQGTLAARVQFAQSQILSGFPRQGDKQPWLIGLRNSLLLVQPLLALDGAGNTLGTLKLDAPAALPPPAYHVDRVPQDGVDFTPGPGTTNRIASNAELARLNDPSGAFLLGRLQQNALVQIETADGQWTKLMYLPVDPSLEGKMVRARSRASYNSTLLYSGRQAELHTGETQQFKFVAGQWIRDGELENNGIRYAADTWSGITGRLASAWADLADPSGRPDWRAG